MDDQQSIARPGRSGAQPVMRCPLVLPGFVAQLARLASMAARTELVLPRGPGRVGHVYPFHLIPALFQRRAVLGPALSDPSLRGSMALCTRIHIAPRTSHVAPAFGIRIGR